MTHRLSVQSLSKEFVTAQLHTQILKNISVEFSQGVSYAIMGASGVGKSTFIHMLAGLDVPTRGQILYDGVDIMSYAQASEAAYLQRHIGLVFQIPYLLRELSVIENIMLPGCLIGQQQAGARDRAAYLLNRVGLAEKMNEYPRTLSMGQQQRVALCRALFNQPSFLLADEPTGALDEQTGQAVADLLLELSKQLGMGLIISTHDTRLARKMNVVYEITNNTIIQKPL